MKCIKCGEDSPTQIHLTCFYPPPPAPEPDELTPEQEIVRDLVHSRAEAHNRIIEDLGTRRRFKVPWWYQLANMGGDIPYPTHEWRKVFKNGKSEFLYYEYA